MSLARVTTWSLGDILTAAALGGEFDNILNNAMAMLSPATANLDLNAHLLINGIYKHDPITFAAQDATPDVSQGTVFKTANATATTITMFDSAVDGQIIWVLINDNHTTLDFTGSNLIGNTGTDWNPSSGDIVQAIFINPYWYCRPSGHEALSVSGQISFPAIQVPSTSQNTLDDYEEGIWTPALTFTSPGDLALTYSGAAPHGRYIKIGKSVTVQFYITTSSFTYSSASSSLLITGLPFTPTSSGGINYVGTLYFQGITRAGFTHFVPYASLGSTDLKIAASGSGQSIGNVVAADVPSGGNVTLVGSVTFEASA